MRLLPWILQKHKKGKPHPGSYWRWRWGITSFLWKSLIQMIWVIWESPGGHPRKREVKGGLRSDSMPGAVWKAMGREKMGPENKGKHHQVLCYLSWMTIPPDFIQTKDFKTMPDSLFFISHTCPISRNWQLSFTYSSTLHFKKQTYFGDNCDIMILSL